MLAILNWAILQFAILPNMTGDQRTQIYPKWMSAPYLYGIVLAFICFGFWFVFVYKGKLATHERKIGVFAMALGLLCGMLIVISIRAVWHI